MGGRPGGVRGGPAGGFSESRGRDAAEPLRDEDTVRRTRVGAVLDLLGGVEAGQRARAGRVFELLGHVGGGRHARREQRERLLLNLRPRLEEARARERELDRRLARRFNVFKYLRTDELGLSRLIADLLDPAPSAEHGQGPVFLNAMLGILSETGEEARAPFGTLRATVATTAKVETELGIPSGFIDITVDIRFDDGMFCLAFENKPYADDGYRQLVKYLEYLDEHYATRFLLVYLPPDDREPGEVSLPPEDREYWRDRGQFRVMPYSGGEVSLASWFGTCRELCRAERLRPYLEDAQSFCRHQFGGQSMTTQSETHAIRKHLFDDVERMHAALAVHDAWPAVRAEVCERFLKQLHRKLEEALGEDFPGVSDFHVQRRSYKGGKKHTHSLRITRDAWTRYDEAATSTRGRSALELCSHKGEPNGWHWGVVCPKSRSKMTEVEKKRRVDLEAMLRRRDLSLSGSDSDSWPQWEYVPRYRNWHPLVPDLAEECEAGAARSRTTSWMACCASPGLRFRRSTRWKGPTQRLRRTNPYWARSQERASPDLAEPPDPVDSD